MNVHADTDNVLNIRLAGMLLGRNYPMATHHVDYLRKRLGYRTDDELQDVVRTGIFTRSVHADTDGLLDHCHCGAVAGFETDSPAPLRMVQTRARCTDCCEQTEWHMNKWDAAQDWNRSMRNQ